MSFSSGHSTVLLPALLSCLSHTVQSSASFFNSPNTMRGGHALRLVRLQTFLRMCPAPFSKSWSLVVRQKLSSTFSEILSGHVRSRPSSLRQRQCSSPECVACRGSRSSGRFQGSMQSSRITSSASRKKNSAVSTSSLVQSCCS